MDEKSFVILRVLRGLWFFSSGVRADRLRAAQKRKCGIIFELSGSSSVVERDLAKVDVAGSTPVSRSRFFPACSPAGIQLKSVPR